MIEYIHQWLKCYHYPQAIISSSLVVRHGEERWLRFLMSASEEQVTACHQWIQSCEDYAKRHNASLFQPALMNA